MFVRLIVIAAMFLWAPLALAGSLPEARTLLESGQYDAAINMALGEETPEGLVLAAETLSAKVMLGYVEDHNKSAKKARKWAEEAAELLPESQEAQVQYALAYGFETRTSSPFRAWRKKLPKKTMTIIQALQARYPEDPRGDALFGAWHLGIVRKAGEKRGRNMFGASEVAGIEGYEKAIAAAPDDVVISSNYAVTILALNTEKYFDRGIEVLTYIVGLPAKNAVEAEIQKRMRALLSFAEDKETLNTAVTALIDQGAPPVQAKAQ